MKNQQADQRLKELFSNLEELIADLPGDTLERQRESESPPPLAVNMEYASPHDRIEAPRGSTSLLLGRTIAIPSPLNSKVHMIGEMEVAPSPDRELSADEQSLTDLKRFSIGVLSGTLVTGIILACTSQMDFIHHLSRFAIFSGEVLFGILGAFAAKSSGTSNRDIWTGAIGWSLIPVWIGLFIILLFYLLSFTSLFGI